MGRAVGAWLALWPAARGAAVPTTTITYRDAAVPAAPWAAARYIAASAPYRRIDRTGAAAPVVRGNASATYAWLDEGTWARYLARVYGASIAGVADPPAPADVDVVHDGGGGLPARSSAGAACPRGDGGRAMQPPLGEYACPASDDAPFKRFNWHAPCDKALYFRRRTAVDAPALPFANRSWVEVSHCGGSAHETVGAWLYAFRGSGLYANVGRTLAFENHQDAALFFLGRPCGRIPFAPDEKLGIFQCDREIPMFVKAARDAGYASLQFTHHCLFPSGVPTFCARGTTRIGQATRSAAADPTKPRSRERTAGPSSAASRSSSPTPRAHRPARRASPFARAGARPGGAPATRTRTSTPSAAPAPSAASRPRGLARASP